MNRLSFPFLCYLILFFVLTMSSCNKDEPVSPEPVPTVENKASFRVSSKIYNFTDFFLNTTAEYDEATNVTLVRAVGSTGNEGVIFELYFPGQEPNLLLYRGNTGSSGGFVSVPEEQSFFLQIVDSPYLVDGMTIEIETYGAVGELITGTFFGQLENSVLGERITISNGSFEIIRTK